MTNNERVTWPNPGIWEFGCIRVAWLACATWLSQVVAKLGQLFASPIFLGSVREWANRNLNLNASLLVYCNSEARKINLNTTRCDSNSQHEFDLAFSTFGIHT